MARAAIDTAASADHKSDVDTANGPGLAQAAIPNGESASRTRANNVEPPRARLTVAACGGADRVGRGPLPGLGTSGRRLPAQPHLADAAGAVGERHRLGRSNALRRLDFPAAVGDMEFHARRRFACCTAACRGGRVDVNASSCGSSCLVVAGNLAACVGPHCASQSAVPVDGVRSCSHGPLLYCLADIALRLGRGRPRQRHHHRKKSPVTRGLGDSDNGVRGRRFFWPDWSASAPATLRQQLFHILNSVADRPVTRRFPLFSPLFFRKQDSEVALRRVERPQSTRRFSRGRKVV